MRNVVSSAPMSVTSMGCQGEDMSRVEAPGSFFSAGASDERIMYSLSSRWIMNGSHASPDSIQITLSLGKRSGSAFSTQLVMWTMLYQTKPSAWTEMNLFISAMEFSFQL